MNKNVKKNRPHKQEVVYERIVEGFDASKANENDYMNERKELEQADVLVQEQASEETGIVVKWQTENKDENGNRLELPARIAFEDSKVNMGRLPVWYLNALGSMNEKELDEFIKKYNEDLSINECIAINLLRGAKQGKKEDVDRFWNIQMKMLNKTNVNMNFNVDNKPDAVVTSLLDDIAKKIQDGNVVAENFKDTPTP